MGTLHGALAGARVWKRPRIWPVSTPAAAHCPQTTAPFPLPQVYASSEEVEVEVVDVQGPCTVGPPGSELSVSSFECIGTYNRATGEFGPVPEDLKQAKGGYGVGWEGCWGGARMSRGLGADSTCQGMCEGLCHFGGGELGYWSCPLPTGIKCVPVERKLLVF